MRHMTISRPVASFAMTPDDVRAYGFERDPFLAAVSAMTQVDGWDLFDVERIERFGSRVEYWDRLYDPPFVEAELVQYFGSLYRGDMREENVVYRFRVELTPCLVTVEVYQAEQA